MQIIDRNLLPETIRLFDQAFKDNKLSEMKKLDFIFWSAGKLKKNLWKKKGKTELRTSMKLKNRK